MDAEQAPSRGDAARPVLVTGAAGQLGQALVATFTRRWTTVGVTRAELDITRADAVREAVARHAPWAIVNCASYNRVDDAEDHAVEALTVNALALRGLARAADEAGAVLVHYSSDFVFDGDADRPYAEDDEPRPRSVYAASKLLGEMFAAGAARHYVLRVESLFGGLGKMTSSFDRIVDAIAAGGSVRLFSDRVVSPSYVFDVAEATAALLAGGAPPGIYHCVNGGSATWEAVGREVAARLGSGATLEAVRMAEVPMRASRPRYCALANDKLRAAGVAMPAWQDALDRYLKARQAARLSPSN